MQSADRCVAQTMNALVPRLTRLYGAYGNPDAELRPLPEETELVLDAAIERMVGSRVQGVDNAVLESILDGRLQFIEYRGDRRQEAWDHCERSRDPRAYDWEEECHIPKQGGEVCRKVSECRASWATTGERD